MHVMDCPTKSIIRKIVFRQLQILVNCEEHFLQKNNTQKILPCLMNEVKRKSKINGGGSLVFKVRLDPRAILPREIKGEVFP